MSQFFVGVSAGELPPAVPLAFATDSSEVLSGPLAAAGGSSVPVANTLRVGGVDGIVTFSTATSGELVISFLGTTETTVGATTASAVVNTTTNTVETYQVLVAGMATTGGSGIGAYGSVVVKNNSGVAAIIGIIDLVVNKDAALSAANISVGVSAGNLIVTVTGVAGLTINWGINFPGIVQS
jgi:hypothetical protein